jgi:hypothetical protein
MGLYIFVCGTIILFLGKILYQQGSLWTYEFIYPLEKAKSINRLLLLLYYLLNLGLLLYSVIIWDDGLSFWVGVIYSIKRTGAVVAILGFLHYQNLLIILLIFHFKSIRLWKP